MRLDVLHDGQTFADRLKLKLISVAGGRSAPDVLRALHYKKARFGAPFSAWLQVVMRGPSEWSIGDRELFATFVSHLNQCRF